MKREKKKKVENFWSLFTARFKRNKTALFALFMILFLIAVAIFAPFIANDKPILLVSKRRVTFPGLFKYPQFRGMDWSKPDIPVDFVIYPLWRLSPVMSDLDHMLEPPSRKHPFGTDDRGMDVFARIIWGTRVSISIGLVSSIIILIIGTLFGAAAGYFGGVTDVLISRFIEIMMSFPSFFLILAVLAFLPPNIINIMVIIGLTGWTGIARLVRGEILKVKTLDYVKAAKINGLPARSIIFSHVLPNAIMPALISATFNVSNAIFIESSLSFLGLGVQPPNPTWGAIIQSAQRYVSSNTGGWLALAPGVAIFITALSYILLGEAIRDAADPKLIE